MSISALTINKTYDDNKVLSEDQLDDAFASVTSWSSIVVAKVPDKSVAESITGAWTLTTPKITGAGAGVATLQYASSSNDRTVTFPDPGGSDSVVYLAATQTLTNKTLTSPVLSAPTFSGTVTVPTADPPPAANALTRESLIKGWASADSSGTSLGDYNVASIAKNATGQYTVTWDRDFTGNYVALVTPVTTGFAMVSIDALALGSTQFSIYNSAGSKADNAFTIIACGTQ